MLIYAYTITPVNIMISANLNLEFTQRNLSRNTADEAAKLAEKNRVHGHDAMEAVSKIGLSVFYCFGGR